MKKIICLLLCITTHAHALRPVPKSVRMPSPQVSSNPLGLLVFFATLPIGYAQRNTTTTVSVTRRDSNIADIFNWIGIFAAILVAGFFVGKYIWGNYCHRGEPVAPAPPEPIRLPPIREETEDSISLSSSYSDETPSPLPSHRDVVMSH